MSHSEIQDVSQFLAEMHNLPNIPKVIQELIDSFNNDDIENAELAEKIARDQTLSLKILRMANSTFYGHSREISSISDAVVTLGFNTLRNLVLTTGVTGAFSNTGHFDIKNFWRSSFKTAATAKLLAKEQKKHSRKKCNLDPETAFTCGMLHNIGEVLVNMHKYEACLKIQAAIKNGEDKNQAEMAELGFSYAEIAAELIRRWRLPEEICLAIVNQDSPDKDTSCNAIHYSEIIYAAKNIVIQQNNPALAEQLDEIFSHKLSPLMIEHSKSLLQHVDVKTLGQEFELLL